MTHATSGAKPLTSSPFLLQQALRDQHGHCHVLMAGGLEAGIHVLLDQLPDGLTIGAQDDETLHTGILHQLCLYADVGVPLCEVLFLTGDRLHELLLSFAILFYPPKAVRQTPCVPHEP